MHRKIFAIVGNPVGKSIYPFIFRKLFELDKSENIYTRIAASDAEEALSTARLISLSGLNIETPYRHDAFDLSGITSRHTENIGAVNGILFDGNEKTGFNTEYKAIEESLYANCRNERKGKVVILGDGPDGRAAACGFGSQGWQVIILGKVLANTVEAALNLGAEPGEFGSLKKHLRGADLVILAGPECTVGTEVLELLSGFRVLLLNCGEALMSRCMNMELDFIHPKELGVLRILVAYRKFFNRGYPGRFSDYVEAMESAYVPGNIISFHGFASTGKNRIGRAVAGKLGIPFTRLDDEIEKETGREIIDIIEEEGTDVFVSCERKILERIIERGERVVLSCGSDTLFSSENRELLKRYSCPVWLVANSELILKKRFFLSYKPVEGESMIDAVNRLYETRRINYAGLSELIVRSDIADTEKTAEKIVNELSAMTEKYSSR